MVRSKKIGPDRKINIEDVAARAGVSITTVSRVINNVASVSKKNRVKVEEAVTHLRYKPNASAQRLARGFTNAFGLVIPGYPGVFHSFYAIELIRGVGHACEKLQKDLIFHISNGIRPLNSSNVDGLIFADIIENKKQVEAAIAHGTPCVIINNEVKDRDVNFIAVDNIKGGEMAADYLSSFGHTRIATITGNLATQSGNDRLVGFKACLEKKKIPLPKEYIYQGDYSRRSARFATEQFLELKERPTAIFAASDDMALEAIAVILENGLKVPEDISVIGFDDNPACLYGPVALTTIKQPLFKMAEDGITILNDIIAGKHKKTTKDVLIPELIVRESCAPVPK